MGSCVICGASVDGRVCNSHEQDVFFEFRGTRPGQLTPGRFYRGRVDGVADFGVFVDVGDRVTGLLHQNELPRRLESYHWTPGDTLFVEVIGIRDNGDVDLGWSIRQSAADFRGGLLDDPEHGESVIDRDDGAGTPDATTADSPDETEPTEDRPSTSTPAPGPDGSAGGTSDPSAPEGGGTAVEAAAGSGPSPAARGAPERVGLGALGNRSGDRVRVEGTVVDIRQTGGPTVFTLRDETGTAACAAFVAPGERAYGDVEVGDAVRIDGVIEHHEGEVQIETDTLSVLDAEERESLEGRLSDALDDRAQPETTDLLADSEPVAAVEDTILEAATAIRRAVMDGRPIVIRHAATADGYLAGAAVERAVLGLIREEHEERDAVYHYVDRHPLEGRNYDLDDATRDLTAMLDRRERHGEKLPLLVFCGAGATAESVDGLSLLSLYDADQVVVDAEPADAEAAEATSAIVTPADGGAGLSVTALAAAIAATANADIAADLGHLPAASYWRDVPDAYRDLAADADYDATDLDAIRKAIALEAFFQAYEGKRELVADLLFGDPALAAHAATQFEERMTQAVETASSHLEERTVGDDVVAVLDTHAFTHRYDFPPTDLLLDRVFEAIEADALIGVDEDALRIRSDPPVDIRAVADRVAEVVDNAGIAARGGRRGSIAFLLGERDVVLDATVGALTNLL